MLLLDIYPRGAQHLGDDFLGLGKVDWHALFLQVRQDYVNRLPIPADGLDNVLII